jgi:Cysteine-rich CWC
MRLEYTARMNAPNPSVCPLCGGPNDCALEAGKRIEDCWCFTAKIAQDVLERIPADHRGKTCICPNCANLETQPNLPNARG